MDNEMSSAIESFMALFATDKPHENPSPPPEVNPAKRIQIITEADDELSSLKSMVSFDLSAILPKLDPEAREESKRKAVTRKDKQGAMVSSVDMHDTHDSSDKLVIVNTPEEVSHQPVNDEPSFKVTTQLQGKPCDDRPPYSYTELIEFALRDRGSLAVRDIYSWIQDNFTFYKNLEDSKWQPSVRHTLTISRRFKKDGKCRGGHQWGLVPNAEQTPGKNNHWKKQKLAEYEKGSIGKNNGISQSPQDYSPPRATGKVKRKRSKASFSTKKADRLAQCSCDEDKSATNENNPVNNSALEESICQANGHTRFQPSYYPSGPHRTPFMPYPQGPYCSNINGRSYGYQNMYASRYMHRFATHVSQWSCHPMKTDTDELGSVSHTGNLFASYSPATSACVMSSDVRNESNSDKNENATRSHHRNSPASSSGARDGTCSLHNPGSGTSNQAHKKVDATMQHIDTLGQSGATTLFSTPHGKHRMLSGIAPVLQHIVSPHENQLDATSGSNHTCYSRNTPTLCTPVFPPDHAEMSPCYHSPMNDSILRHFGMSYIPYLDKSHEWSCQESDTLRSMGSSPDWFQTEGLFNSSFSGNPFASQSFHAAHHHSPSCQQGDAPQDLTSILSMDCDGSRSQMNKSLTYEWPHFDSGHASYPDPYASSPHDFPLCATPRNSPVTQACHDQTELEDPLMPVMQESQDNIIVGNRGLSMQDLDAALAEHSLSQSSNVTQKCQMGQYQHSKAVNTKKLCKTGQKICQQDISLNQLAENQALICSGMPNIENEPGGNNICSPTHISESLAAQLIRTCFRD